MNKAQKDDYGVVIFREGTSPAEKRKGLFFFTLLSVIVLSQACYWVFANSVEPIIMGMPFGLFSVVMLIALEFVALVTMFAMEPKEEKENDQ